MLATAVVSAAPLASAQAPADSTGTSSFVVLVRGARVGSQSVSVSRDGTGWLISATGQLQAPFEVVTTRFELTYAADWQPQRLVMEGRQRGQLTGLTAAFGLTTVTTEVMQNGVRNAVTRDISPRTIVLPPNAFAAYEGLAARLASASPGTRLPVFIVPDGEAGATIDRVTPRRIATPNGAVDVREFILTVTSPQGPIPLEIWTDSRQRLARLVLPTESIMVIREDIASVMAREELIRHPGDADAFIPANGFTLGATLTKPSKPAERTPAVVLVSGPGPQDRDFTAYGIPMFGQLAVAFADAGFMVVRYDGRGVGQSGGRVERAGLAEYADDLVRVIAWLRKRRDVDADQVALVGYGDGGPIALMAAAREKRVRAVALVAAPGRTGREVILEQQQLLLAQLPLSEADKAARRDLQSRIIEATISDRGWESVPPEIRRQSDTPLFRSWVLFDPEDTLGRLRVPVAIVHGSLDREVPVAHADRLEEISRGRRNVPPIFTNKVIVPGMNHLLVPAPTGDVSEYDALTDRTLSPQLTDALISWLRPVFASR